MAETLGMLCDKLSIVNLKLYHTDDKKKIESLHSQAKQMQQEIDEFVSNAISGQIPMHKLTFASNKVFKKEGNEASIIEGDLGAIFYQLANINCKLWHEQEKVYDFEKVSINEKDKIVKQLAILNLERNLCIDKIDSLFVSLISKK